MSDIGPLGDRETMWSPTHRHQNCYHEHHYLSTLPYLRVAWVKQRFRSVSTYLRHCCVARGFDSTISTETGSASSSSFSFTFFSTFSSSLTKYTPDSSFPWVPPHTATRDNLGKCTTLSTSIWLRGRDTVEKVWDFEGVCNETFYCSLCLQFWAEQTRLLFISSYTILCLFV